MESWAGALKTWLLPAPVKVGTGSTEAVSWLPREASAHLAGGQEAQEVSTWE